LISHLVFVLSSLQHKPEQIQKSHEISPLHLTEINNLKPMNHKMVEIVEINSVEMHKISTANIMGESTTTWMTTITSGNHTLSAQTISPSQST
jgi:hypothetical protein